MTTSTQPTLALGSWALDPAHSSIDFAIRHLGISKVRGRFTRFETIFVVGDDGKADIEAVVYLDSIDTGNSDRDAHVKTADFLDVANRPTLTFRASGVSVTPEFSVAGEAIIGGATKPITLGVEWGGVQEFGPTGQRHAGFAATGEIKRSDFGIGGPMLGMLSDAVKCELDIQLIEPTSG